jgi:coniferyl-aldehyde dehydrogenase
MSTIEHATTTSDDRAIGELHAMVERQRAAFLADPFPSLEERQGLLMAIAGMMMANRTRIEEAMHADFGGHPTASADLIEVLGVAGRAAFVAERLEKWMAPEPREVNPALFGSGHAYVQLQPKGVVGNISPWNFPFDLSVGPLVEMLAAGNRVVLKPSELAPACAELLRDIIRSTFDPGRVDVAVGGLDLAREFSRVRWDHLLYTGSPAVGRQIAMAAAEQLVPVTLELGGKCPAILTDDSIDAESVKQVLGTKAIKNGQMCISVDYCLVPRDRMEDFATLAAEHVAQNMVDYCSSASNTGIINDRHFERIQSLVDDARTRGADVRPLEGDGTGDPAARMLPISLVLDPPDDAAVMREEIFGPILPVKPYDDLDEAIDYVNAGERPLGLYIFSKNDSIVDDVLRRTTSGGADVNAAAVHGALPSLPFGGIGHSGSGRHHGIDGFREFSNSRAVFVRGEGDLIDAFAPPYGAVAEAVIGAAFAPAE